MSQVAFTRRIGEQVTIGEGEQKIVLTVLDVRGTAVRLGIEAPAGVRIVRSEVAGQEET